MSKLLAMLLAATVAVAGDVVELSAPIATAPPLRQPPTLDGRIAAAEWADATSFIGFMGWHTDTFSERSGQTWIGWDEYALYVAVATELPPSGELAATATPDQIGELRACRDDHLEVWVMPDPATGAAVQFLMNANAAAMLLLRQPGAAAKVAAPAGWAFAQDRHNGLWQCEMSVPWKELGGDALPNGREIRLRVVRLWQNPQEYSTLGPCPGGFADAGTMLALRLDRTAPRSSLAEIGDVWDARVRFRLALTGGTAPTTVATSLIVQPKYDQPEVVQGEQFDLAAGQTETAELIRDGGYFTAGEKHYAAVTATAGDRTLYDYRFGWFQRGDRRWSGPAAAPVDLGIEPEITMAAHFDDPVDDFETVDGHIGKAIRLSGAKDLSWPAADHLNVDHGALEFWMRPGNWDAESPGMSDIFTWQAKSNKLWRGPTIRRYGPPQERPVRLCYFAKTEGDPQIIGDRQVHWERGRWYHVAATWDNGAVHVYLDGREVGVGKLRTAIPADAMGDTLVLTGGGQEQFTDFDELYLYRRALSPAEIRWAYESHDPDAYLRLTRNVIARLDRYPYLNRVDVHLDPVLLPAGPTAVPWKLVGPDDEVLRQGEAGVTAEEPLVTLADLPELAPGNYRVVVALGGSDHSATFSHQAWDFEHNRLGIADQVMPPFTPLRVQGPEIACVGRTYRFGGAGLIERLVSLDRDLLAGPIQLRARHGDVETPLTATATTFPNATDTVVTGQVRMAGAGLTATADLAIEYDGMVKVDLTLVPTGGPVAVDGLDLVIPLRPEAARLIHTITDQARGNTSDYLPPGDGIVWRSGQETRTALLGTFVAYIFVGGVERGICWFADNDRDWVTRDDLDTQTVTRFPDRAELRAHLVGLPTALDAPRRIVFGIMATPAKPRPQGWRRVLFNGERDLADAHHLFAAQLIPSTAGNGRASYDWVPEDMDFSIIEVLAKAATTGEVDEDWIMGPWAAKFERYADVMGTFAWRNNIEDTTSFARLSAVHANNLARNRPNAFFVYSHMRVLANTCLPLREYHAEWTRQPGCYLPFDPETSLGIKGVPVAHVPSCVDYYVWANVQTMKHGAGGIYFDVSKLQGSYNLVMSAAYVRPDGKIQPSVDIFGMREVLKRTAVAAWQMGKTGPWIHCTNCVPIPVFGWGWATFDLEGRYGITPFQTRYSEGYLLAETSGLHTGTVPVSLGTGAHPRHHGKDVFNTISRTQYATLMPFEIQPWGAPPLHDAREALYAFGYGLDDCRVWPAYRDDQPVTVEGPDHRCLVLGRDGQALVFLGNWTGEPADFQIRPGPELALPAAWQAVNGETAEALPRTGDAVAVHLPAWDFAIIVCK